MKLTLRFRSIATAAAFAVAVASCANATPGSPAGSVTNPAPTSAGNPVATSTPSSTTSAPFGARILGTASAFDAPCILDGAQIRPDLLFWTDCDRSTPSLTSRIIGYSRPSGPSGVLYQPQRAGAAVGLQQISAGWIAWSEYLDRSTAKDTKLFALARGSSTPILVDDMTTHGPLASLTDMTLDESDVYWTLPLVENGVWHGRLMRQHLPDGQATVAVQAPLGMIIGWPTVSGGMMAYELRSQTAHPQDHVVLRFPNGEARQLTDTASSEPALGDGFVAYKAAERFDQGQLAAYRFQDGVTVPLGLGEGPFSAGPYVTWLPLTPKDDIVRLARPLAGCVDKLSEKPIPGLSRPYVGFGFMSWVVRATEASAVDARVFVAPITVAAGASCTP